VNDEILITDFGSSRIRLYSIASGTFISVATTSSAFLFLHCSLHFTRLRLFICPDRIQTITIKEPVPDRVSNLLTVPNSFESSGMFQFYATDEHTVRMIHAGTGIQQILSGCPKVVGFADGTLDVSRLNRPNGLALSANANTLYVCDQYNHRIRAIDIKTCDTSTVAGSGQRKHKDGIGTAASIHFPRACDWDRSNNVEPFTFLYITATGELRRLNVKTGQMTSIKCSVNVDPAGIVCLSGSGIIIFSCIGHAVYGQSIHAQIQWNVWPVH
jgi:DNA-binding beta-propeller fold protein YncE